MLYYLTTTKSHLGWNFIITLYLAILLRLSFHSTWSLDDDNDKVIQWLGLGRRMLQSVGIGHPGRQRRQVRPTYHGSTVWGNTFCQSLTVGLASYHFLTTEEA
jgi:hypothetical protein